MTAQPIWKLCYIVVTCLLGLWLLKIVNDTVVSVFPEELTSPAGGLLLTALGVVVILDRELALRVYRSGAPYRPSDRTILFIVRSAMLVFVAVGAYFAFTGVRALLKTFDP
jgi:hypothetical protein